MNTLLTVIAWLLLGLMSVIICIGTVGDGSLKWMIRQGEKGNRDKRCHQRVKNWWELEVK